MTMEEVQIRFNDFHDEIFKSFKREEFCDVTLLGDDKIPVSAHKFLLASSSSFFRNLFESHQGPETWIHVEGLNHLDIQTLLYVIYNRNTNWENVDLTRVVKISKYLYIDFKPEPEIEDASFPFETPPPVDTNYAEETKESEVKIKILNIIDVGTTSNDTNEETVKVEQKSVETELEDFDAELFEMCVESFQLESSVDPMNVQPVIDDPRHHPTVGRSTKKIRMVPKSPGWTHNAYWSNEQELLINKSMETMVTFQDGVYLCKVCKKTKNKRSHISSHLELHLPSLQFICDNCGDIKHTSNALRKHVNSFHQ